MRYPEHLLKLISVLKKLPGIGTKSAERFAFQMITWQEEHLREMGKVISEIKEKLTTCLECGALASEKSCFFCNSPHREHKQICIVASQKDIFLIEETREYKGLYHVLEGQISPLYQRMLPKELIEKIKKRIETHRVEELILALDATLEGDAIALLLKKELCSLPIALSRPAMGLPLGSSLDFIDGGTLSRALSGRRAY